MFLKGFICGWIGMAAILMFLLWGVTPRVTNGVFYDYPVVEPVYDSRSC